MNYFLATQNDYVQYGILGFIIIILLKEIIPAILNMKSKQGNESSASKCKFSSEPCGLILADGEQADIKNWLKDLYEAHNVKDGDGVPVWYVKRSFMESVEEIAKHTKELAEQNKHNTEVIKKIQEDASEDRKMLTAVMQAVLNKMQ